MSEAEVKPDQVTEPAAAEKTEVKAAPKKRKVKRTVAVGQIHIKSSFNNTLVTITDPQGNTLLGASAGSSGFKGSKKGTAYAAQVATDKATTAARQQFGMQKASVFVSGVGMGRESAIRSLVNSGISIESLTDKTGIAHGGTRAPRPRRV